MSLIASASVTREVIHQSMMAAYPASFSGMSYLFWSALTGLGFMCGASILAFAKTAKITWKDRHSCASRSLIMCYRYIVMCWMAVTFIRCAPELLYLLSFNEVSPGLAEMFLNGKRFADSVAPFPFLVGVSIMFLASDDITVALKDGDAATRNLKLAGPDGIERIKDLFYMFGGISILSLIVTTAKYFSKIYI